MKTRLAALAKLAAVNAAIVIVLLVPVELAFGTWIRAMGPSDLKRFSIPIGVQFEFDTSKLYGNGQPSLIHYSRDEYGLRGSHRALDEVDVLTVGGSTTEQRYLDDRATWQAVAEARLREAGTPLVIANAGVDGQSTVGHLFNFEFWFPALMELRPQVVLFYVGVNDTVRSERRGEFDATVDASSWKRRSAVYQLLRTAVSNSRARRVGVYHGRRPELGEGAYTNTGLLDDAARNGIASEITEGFLRNVGLLTERVRRMGAQPVFMTQTAFAWTADPDAPSRGITDTITILGAKVNYADVSFFHQQLNRALLAFCADNGVTCLNLAHEVSFGEDDYYDYVHNTPSGAAKIGEYLATKLQTLQVARPSEP